ncbi:unnamed protein product [Fraxinus pennsylvanica]|uniref:Uncharacterized protein n=1 Tax=Fraxinus pennsylvanica TaxID=56036 RepID=A0AAD2DL53_9LAMI|nr:unnamed protein product [Fraxinus pennsylvanica]
MSSLCGGDSHPSSTFKPFSNNHNYKNAPSAQDHVMEEPETEDAYPTQEGSDPKKFRRMEPEEADSVTQIATTDNCTNDQSAVTKSLKRLRLVWTPQLRKHFVDVVAHLRLKNAVPKTIMLDVEALFTINVSTLAVTVYDFTLLILWEKYSGSKGLAKRASYISIPADFFTGMSSLISVEIDNNPFSAWEIPETLGNASTLQNFLANPANIYYWKNSSIFKRSSSASCH